jgi:hypothetical protein
MFHLAWMHLVWLWFSSSRPSESCMHAKQLILDLSISWSTFTSNFFVCWGPVCKIGKGDTLWVRAALYSKELRKRVIMPPCPTSDCRVYKGLFFLSDVLFLLCILTVFHWSCKAVKMCGKNCFFQHLVISNKVIVMGVLFSGAISGWSKYRGEHGRV